jgi:hypothetical protein
MLTVRDEETLARRRVKASTAPQAPLLSKIDEQNLRRAVHEWWTLRVETDGCFAPKVSVSLFAPRR